jgi:hypothetical protein
MQRTTRIGILGGAGSATLAIGMGLGMLASSAVSNAHFVGTPTITRNDDTLTVSGKVAGLGNVTQIHVEVSGDVACINPGTKHPKAANKEGFSAGGDFPVQNGKALFSVTTTSPDISPTCDPPMELQYSNVVVTVTAADGTNISYSFSGTF